MMLRFDMVQGLSNMMLGFNNMVLGLSNMVLRSSMLLRSSMVLRSSVVLGPSNMVLRSSMVLGFNNVTLERSNMVLGLNNMVLRFPDMMLRISKVVLRFKRMRIRMMCLDFRAGERIYKVRSIILGLVWALRVLGIGIGRLRGQLLEVGALVVMSRGWWRVGSVRGLVGSWSQGIGSYIGVRSLLILVRRRSDWIRSWRVGNWGNGSNSVVGRRSRGPSIMRRRSR